MIDPLSIWKSEFDNLPKDAPTVIQGMQNLANFVDSRVSGKLMLGPPIIGSSSYTFAKAVFVAPLIVLQATVDPVSGKIAMATAWQTAALASIMTLSAGASVGAPTPATTFAAPPLCVVNPASLAAAYASLLANLLALVPTKEKSKIPDLFFSAFSSLTYIVSGINMIVPTPTPLIVPVNPVM